MRSKRTQKPSSVVTGESAPNGRPLIEERERAEDARREAERKYRDIFENAVEGIFQTSPDGGFITANPALARMLGFASPEELIRARDIHGTYYVHPERRDEFRRLLDQCDTVRGFEFEAYRKDGTKIWMSDNVRAVRDTSGKLLYYEGTTEDITERKRAEELLKQSRSQLAEAQRLAHIGSWNWDIENNSLTWSDELYQIYGLNREELKPSYEGFLDCIHPEDRQFVIESVEECLRNHEPFSHHERIVRPSGEVRILHSHGSVVCDDIERPIRIFGTCQDVTESTQAENARSEAELQYRDIFENALEGIFQTTPDGEFITVNPALARMLGFASPEELIRERTDIGRTHYVESERRVEFKRLLDQHDRVQGFEFECYRKDGTRIWMSDNVRAVRDAAGKLLYYEGTVEDITERKRAEEALRESEERFSRAFHSNPAPLIITRLDDGRFLNANDAFLLAFEYGHAEVIGETVLGLNIYVDPEDRKTLIHKLQEQGSLRGYESRARTKSGRVLDLWVSVEPITLQGQQCILSTAYDITERKRVEEALRKSEERYRELFENDKDAIYVHDLNGVYTSVNRAAERLSGYSREEIIGKHFRDFVSPEYLRLVGENFGKKLEETGETNYEVEIINRDGAHIPVEISSRLIHENGVAVGVQGSVRDITERKRAQQALLTYSRRLLEAQEAERGRIARELHDQIGQMLTALKLSLHAIAAADDPGEARRLIEENLKLLDEALEQVRDLSVDLRPLLLDDLGLVTALRWFIDHQMQRTGVRVQFTTDSLDPDLRFSTELETACFRIAQEALTNVARHARANTVTVRLSRNRDYLILLVEDDGVGFDIEALQGRALANTTLGLRGMQERAHAVGGRVKIDSATDKGTQVFVELPIKMRNDRNRKLQERVRE
jgi:PAS domain S-box-containing protein